MAALARARRRGRPGRREAALPVREPHRRLRTGRRGAAGGAGARDGPDAAAAPHPARPRPARRGPVSGCCGGCGPTPPRSRRSASPPRAPARASGPPCSSARSTTSSSRSTSSACARRCDCSSGGWRWSSPVISRADQVDLVCWTGQHAALAAAVAVVARLQDVRAALGRASGAVTAEEVAAATGVARVTARRYLEYLVPSVRRRSSPSRPGPAARATCLRAASPMSRAYVQVSPVQPSMS